jgi:hypothetical protein
MQITRIQPDIPANRACLDHLRRATEGGVAAYACNSRTRSAANHEGLLATIRPRMGPLTLIFTVCMPHSPGFARLLGRLCLPRSPRTKVSERFGGSKGMTDRVAWVRASARRVSALACYGWAWGDTSSSVSHCAVCSTRPGQLAAGSRARASWSAWSGLNPRRPSRAPTASQDRTLRLQFKRLASRRLVVCASPRTTAFPCISAYGVARHSPWTRGDTPFGQDRNRNSLARGSSVNILVPDLPGEQHLSSRPGRYGW